MTNSIQKIQQEIKTSLIGEKTPAKYIKKRPGAGGMMLDYVEIGYIINQLNKIFNYRWNFEITHQEIGRDQILVRGKLSGYDPITSTFISKEQYGGSDIKKYSQGTKIGQPLDIANDLKSAGSDALKKCASLFGIAQDVYWKGADI